jgi:AcrR family transcriptional regulator
VVHSCSYLGSGGRRGKKNSLPQRQGGILRARRMRSMGAAAMSYEGAIVVRGVNYGKRLPRGRHGIPKELVIANQRERLLSAATTIFAEQGYASLTVHTVIDRAGVSRATFYKIFDDKLECVIAAQHHAFDEFRAVIADACATEQAWEGKVEAAVAASIEFAKERQAEARLLLASSQALSEPQLASQGLDVQSRLVELLRLGTQGGEGGAPKAGLSEQVAVGAAVSLVSAHLANDEVERLGALTPDIVQLILAPYRSADSNA